MITFSLYEGDFEVNYAAAPMLRTTSFSPVENAKEKLGHILQVRLDSVVKRINNAS